VLLLFHIELSVMGLIGIILLIASSKERHYDGGFRHSGRARAAFVAHDAIRQACLLRFRPIMMTTMAALLGHYRWRSVEEPDRSCASRWIHHGRRLIVSQALTLFTTPVCIFIWTSSACG